MAVAVALLGLKLAAPAQRLDVKELTAPVHFMGLQILADGTRWSVAENGQLSTWKRSRRKPSSTFNLGAARSVAFSGSEFGVVVGGSGLIMSTKDSGKNWRTEKSPFESGLSDVSCPTADACWAVGEWGTILKRDPNGTWELQISGTWKTLTAVNFFDSLNGCAVGDGGVVVRTYDGGINWFVFGAGTGRLNAVHFEALRTIWVAGDDGVYRTNDGGTTWTAVNVEGSKIVGFGIDKRRRIVAVRADGKNMRTADDGKSWKRKR